MQSATFAQRFVPTRLLEDGDRMSTFLATDLEDDRQVLIKSVALDALSSSTQSGLEHQAHVLGGLEGTSLSAPMTVGRQDGRLYSSSRSCPGSRWPTHSRGVRYRSRRRSRSRWLSCARLASHTSAASCTSMSSPRT